MSRFSRLGYDLYEGHRSVDFIGRRWQWYAFSAVLVLVALYGLAVPKLNLGIEFEGGVEYRVAMGQGQATDQVVEDVREAVAGSGIENAEQPTVNTSGRDNIRIQTEPLTTDQADQVTRLIQEETGVAAGDISQESIGPSWGRAVAERALIGLGVFLVLGGQVDPPARQIGDRPRGGRQVRDWVEGEPDVCGDGADAVPRQRSTVVLGLAEQVVSRLLDAREVVVRGSHPGAEIRVGTTGVLRSGVALGGDPGDLLVQGHQ